MYLECHTSPTHVVRCQVTFSRVAGAGAMDRAPLLFVSIADMITDES